jgi:hypothetical protein
MCLNTAITKDGCVLFVMKPNMNEKWRYYFDQHTIIDVTFEVHKFDPKTMTLLCSKKN